MRLPPPLVTTYHSLEGSTEEKNSRKSQPPTAVLRALVLARSVRHHVVGRDNEHGEAPAEMLQLATTLASRLGTFHTWCTRIVIQIR